MATMVSSSENPRWLPRLRKSRHRPPKVNGDPAHQPVDCNFHRRPAVTGDVDATATGAAIVIEPYNALTVPIDLLGRVGGQLTLLELHLWSPKRIKFFWGEITTSWATPSATAACRAEFSSVITSRTEARNWTDS